MAGEPKTLAAQLKMYFGFKEGQTMSEFMAEIKALDAGDRAYFTDLLNKAGYPVKES